MLPVKPTPKTPEPQPEVATELPKTGLESALQSLLGLGSLTAASYYYITSRRN